MPVLSRTSRLVMVYDRDAVSRLNPNGRWPGTLVGKAGKVATAIEPRYDATTIAIRRTFERNTRLPRVDLVVLAPDRAIARRNAVRNLCVPETAWIVDMRVARDQLVVWTFKKGSEIMLTWLDDINSYVQREAEPQPCGRFHDNIPLVAGTTAASFLSWWTTREPEEGIWSPQLSQPWENMSAVQHEEEELDLTEEDIARQQAWDEAHHVEEEVVDAQSEEGAVIR